MENNPYVGFGTQMYKEVCLVVESTSRCLLKPIELPEAFWFEPIFQGLGEYEARSLKRPVVLHCLGEFT